MNTYVAAFLLLLVSIICFAATAAGCAYNKKSGYTIAGIFLIYALLLGIAAFLDSDLLRILLIPVPVGIFMTLMGFSMIVSGFLYSQKTEGIYVDCVFDHVNHHEYYSLIFKYQTNRHTIQSRSDDSYLLYNIQKHYEIHSSYTIWVNPKKPKEFRVKRFSSLYAGIMAAIFGIAALMLPIKMLFDSLNTFFLSSIF